GPALPAWLPDPARPACLPRPPTRLASLHASAISPTVTRPAETSPLAAATAPLRAVAGQVTDLVRSLGTDRQTVLLALAAVTGTVVGLAVTIFYWLIDFIQLTVLRGVLSTPISDAVLVPAFVALGLVGARALVRWGARGSDGENVPDVMYKVSKKGG